MTAWLCFVELHGPPLGDGPAAKSMVGELRQTLTSQVPLPVHPATQGEAAADVIFREAATAAVSTLPAHWRQRLTARGGWCRKTVGHLGRC